MRCRRSEAAGVLGHTVGLDDYMHPHMRYSLATQLAVRSTYSLAAHIARLSVTWTAV